jgi:hypothetical protein
MASRPVIAHIEDLPIIGVFLVRIAMFLIAAPPSLRSMFQKSDARLSEGPPCRSPKPLTT